MRTDADEGRGLYPGEGGEGRDESPAERIDRNWGELLQEMRVIQTGIQILFGFLLTLPFQARFPRLDAGQRSLYVVVAALVAVATLTNLAPIVAHRVLFRRQVKDVLLATSNQIAKVSLAALGLALVGGMALVVDVVFGTVAALSTGAAGLVLLVGLWVVLPVLMLRAGRAGES